MAKIWKSLWALSISLIFIAPFGSLFWQYQTQLYAHKKSIKKALLRSTPKDDLIEFRWSKPEAESLDWKEQDEFEYQGEMYDVVEKQERKDSLILWCYWDYAETQLHQKFKNLLAKNPYRPKPENKNVNLLLKSLQAIGPSPMAPIGKFSNHLSPNCIYLFNVTDFQDAPPTPPPLNRA